MNDTDEDLRIFRESRNRSDFAEDVRAYLWPEDQPVKIIESLLGYSVDLANEWDWKRNSTSANNIEMAELDKSILRAKRFIENEKIAIAKAEGKA
jgi:hypothetical protein